MVLGKKALLTDILWHSITQNAVRGQGMQHRLPEVAVYYFSRVRPMKRVYAAEEREAHSLSLYSRNMFNK